MSHDWKPLEGSEDRTPTGPTEEYVASRDADHRLRPENAEPFGAPLERMCMMMAPCESCGGPFAAFVFETADGSRYHLPVNIDFLTGVITSCEALQQEIAVESAATVLHHIFDEATKTRDLKADPSKFGPN
jgi:hypothetical protein